MIPKSQHQCYNLLQLVCRRHPVLSPSTPANDHLVSKCYTIQKKEKRNKMEHPIFYFKI